MAPVRMPLVQSFAYASEQNIEQQAAMLAPITTMDNGSSTKVVAAVPSAPASTKEKKIDSASAKAAKDNNAVVAQLTKTKMCAFFERGKCGSMNCRYAHSRTELRTPPNLQKTRLCRAFLAGACNDAENCTYAHGETDLRVTAGIYKTQMCNFFDRGYCKKGDRCNHAHGTTNLRPFGSPGAKTPPPLAKSPLSSAKGSSDGASTAASSGTRTQKSPLPLSELLVDEGSFQNSSMHMMSPTRSVAEMVSLGISPLPRTAPALWGYGTQGVGSHNFMSPVSAAQQARFGSVASPYGDAGVAIAAWQRDAADLLLAPVASNSENHFQGPLDFPMTPSTVGKYASVAGDRLVAESRLRVVEPMTPVMTRGPLSAVSTPFIDTPMSSGYAGYGFMPRLPAGLGPLPSVGLELQRLCSPEADRCTRLSFADGDGVTPESDPVSINLNERLASLDCVVRGLHADMAGLTEQLPSQSTVPSIPFRAFTTPATVSSTAGSDGKRVHRL